MLVRGRATRVFMPTPRQQGTNHMKRFTDLAVDCVLACALAFAVAGLPATAHPSSEKFPVRWKQDLSVPWQFSTTYPDANGWRPRLVDSDQRWNSLAGSMHFVKEPGDANNHPHQQCPSDPYKNVVHKGPLGSRLIGDTIVCTYANDASRIYSFHLLLSDDEP